MTAAIGRRAAMLADKDRIFTNVYGFQSWHIDAAMKRGDWDNTRKLLEIGPDAIIDAIKASGLRGRGGAGFPTRSEEHTSELQSLMRISYAVFCLKQKN